MARIDITAKRNKVMPDTYIYARFSPRPNAEECRSIEVQTDACQKYCEMNGWKVTETYADRETSARTTNFCDRKSAGILTSKLKRGDRIVCARLDRAFRNTVDGLTTFEKFYKKDVTFCFAAQDGCSLTTATAQGKLLLSMMLSITEYEPALISERTKAGFKNLKKNMVNVFATEKIPYGYESDFSEGFRGDTGYSNKLKFCEEELSIIRLILLRYMAGKNRNAIGVELNAEGKLCRGRPWVAKKVERITNQWIYDEKSLQAVPRI